MNPDSKAKPETKTADKQANGSEENTLSPKELGEVAGGRRGGDPCEGGEIS